jgi:prepilin-type N-terminal cleavage/methylation domain-containing protein
MKIVTDRKHIIGNSSPRRANDRGFTLIELLIGMTILTFGLLGIAAMFPMGYFVVSDAGKMTMTLTGTRQILEDVRSVPFQNLGNLNGFDTNNAATLPAANPERDIARRWRYALAGEGSGFTFTTAEKAAWTRLTTTAASPNSNTSMTSVFGGRGVISVVAQTATLSRITITITIPGRTKTVNIATLVSRM